MGGSRVCTATTIIIFLSILLNSNSCLFPEYDDCRRGYHFIIPWTLSPANYVYSVGDTIELTWTFPFENTDTATNEKFNLENVALPKGYSLIVTKIANGETEAVDFHAISVINEVGDLIVEPFVTLSFSISPLKTAASYELSTKLILNETGVFKFTFSYDHSMFDDQRPIGLCKVEGIQYHSFLNGGDVIANHYDQAVQLLDTLEAPAVYRRGGTYVFEVVD